VLPSLQGFDELRASTLADVQAKSAVAVAARRPLARKPDKAAAVKLYNPRFEDDYVAGKDFDPDRCRAAGRKP
jgi:nucleolar protein 14